jgi:hypothetical protein
VGSLAEVQSIVLRAAREYLGLNGVATRDPRPATIFRSGL